MKGGSTLKDVVGPRFESFLNAAIAEATRPGSVKELALCSTLRAPLPAGAQGSDVSSEFTNFLIVLGNALRTIDAPNADRQKKIELGVRAGSDFIKRLKDTLTNPVNVATTTVTKPLIVAYLVGVYSGINVNGVFDLNNATYTAFRDEVVTVITTNAAFINNRDLQALLNQANVEAILNNIATDSIGPYLARRGNVGNMGPHILVPMIENIAPQLTELFASEFGRRLGLIATGNVALNANANATTLDDNNMAALKEMIETPEKARLYSHVFVVINGHNTLELTSLARNGDNVVAPGGAVVPATARLNLKKVNTMAPIQGAIFGGALGDIVLETFIPQYDMTGLWINNVRYAPNNPNVLVELFDRAYRNVDPVNLVIPGGLLNATADVPLTLATMDSQYRNLPFSVNWDDMLAQRLSSMPRPGAPGAPTPARTVDENLRRAMAYNYQGVWQRNPGGDNADTFTQMLNKQDLSQNTFQGHANDQCSLSKLTAAECQTFLNQCVNNGNDYFDEACNSVVRTFLSTDRPNIAVTDMISEIKKVNPQVAFNILKKFNFKTYEKIVDGLNTRMVWNVEQWLANIDSAESKAYFSRNGTQPPRDDGNVTRLIASIKNNNQLLNYLDLLSAYVNNLRIVLNKERQAPVPNTLSFRQPDKSFALYDHRRPLAEDVTRTGIPELARHIARLRTTLMQQLPTIGTTLVSSVLDRPTGVFGIPGLNPALTTQMMYTQNPTIRVAVPFTGGSTSGQVLTDKLNLHASSNGSALLKDIYNNIIRSFNSEIQLDPETRRRIEEKFTNLQNAEQSLNLVLGELHDIASLYTISRGMINGTKLPLDEWKNLITKQSKVLEITKAYSTRAYNLTNVLQALIDAAHAIASQNGTALTVSQAPVRPAAPVGEPMNMYA